MTGTVLYGLGAGLTSALLYGSVFTGSTLAVVLFYLAPLPLMLAALGWGWQTAALGALAGALADAAVLGADVGLFFALTCAAPAIWLCRLAMLSRLGESGPHWYPPGRLVAWAAAFAIALGAVAMIAIGPDAESFRANVTAALEQHLGSQPGEEADEAELERMSDYLAKLLLPATVSVWLITILANLWAAGRTLASSSRLARPWPDLHALDLPRPFIAVAVASLAASLLPGAAGLVGVAALGAAIIAYLVVGLSILHAITLGLASRRMLLAIAYVAMFAFVFIALIVAAIGIAEPWIRLRARARGRNPPRGPD
jgi:hypothetical protein